MRACVCVFDLGADTFQTPRPVTTATCKRPDVLLTTVFERGDGMGGGRYHGRLTASRLSL